MATKKTRVPVHTVILVRDGKRVVPTVGKPFDFTDEEIASITKANKFALRKPVNEVVIEPATNTNAAKTDSQTTTTTANKGGTKGVKATKAETADKGEGADAGTTAAAAAGAGADKGEGDGADDL